MVVGRIQIDLTAILGRGVAVFELWLAGAGPTVGACQHLVAERQLESRVKFLGFQPDPSSLYLAADIAVHASRRESLSNFLIEAQAHGLPAVVYAAQGIAECFIPGETGWVVPQGDRTGFLARLQPLLTDPAFRRGAGARARSFAMTQFDPARQLRAYLDLFTRLVQSSGRP